MIVSSFQKAKDWAYEKEFRYILKLDDCEPSGGLFFFRFYTTALAEVIMGPRFVSGSYLERLVKSRYGPGVKILQARMDPAKYVVLAE